MTGDNGERFIVFVHCHANPLDSAWKWVATRAEAEEIAAKINKDRDCDEAAERNAYWQSLSADDREFFAKLSQSSELSAVDCAWTNRPRAVKP